MLGWHFLAEDRRLRYGTQDIVEAGRTYTADGPLAMCRNGMHASRRALDALSYAPGSVICRVRLTEEICHDTDKAVARHRQVLWIADATDLLHEFALSVATDALCAMEAIGERVDPRSWNALEVKTRWLRGRASNYELAAAWDAARAAAWDAAGAAARDAAWDAAGAAARDAARDAARAAEEDWQVQRLRAYLEGRVDIEAIRRQAETSPAAG